MAQMLEPKAGVPGDLVDGVRILAPRLQRGARHECRHRPPAIYRVLFLYPDETVGVAVWQRAQQRRVDHSKHRRRGPDAQCEGGQRHGRKPKALSQHPQAVPNVLDEGIHVSSRAQPYRRFVASFSSDATAPRKVDGRPEKTRHRAPLGESMPWKECGLRPRRPDRPEQATPESRWADRARRSRTGTARGWRTKVVICRRPGHRQSIRWPLQGQHEYPVGTGVTSRIATDPDPVPWLQRLPAQPLLTQLGRIVEFDGPCSCAALFAHNHEMDQRVRIAVKQTADLPLDRDRPILVIELGDRVVCTRRYARRQHDSNEDNADTARHAASRRSRHDDVPSPRRPSQLWSERKGSCQQNLSGPTGVGRFCE